MEFSPPMCDTQSMSGLGGTYWRFWTTAGLSNLADGVLKVALPLVAIGFTRSPVLVGGLTFAFTLPWLLFALPAGAIVDRFDRRRLMLGANVVRLSSVAAVVLALVFHRGSVLALYAVAICAGSAETIYDNAAQSVVPQVVRPDQLVRANGRMFGAQLTANELVGPPLAGLLVAAGASVALGTPVALWLLAVLALLFVRGSYRTERTPATLRADIAEGIRYFLHHRLLRTFAILGGTFNVASSATQAILVLYAVGSASVLGLTEQGYTLLVGTIAAGSLVGSFLAERVTALLGRARTLTASFLAAALLISMPAITTNPYLIGAAFCTGGIGVVIANVVVLSLRQRITPPHVLSRVNSGSLLITWGTKPLGAAAGAVLAQFVGLRAVFVIMGAVAFVAMAGMTTVSDRTIDAAEHRQGHENRSHDEAGGDPERHAVAGGQCGRTGCAMRVGHGGQCRQADRTAELLAGVEQPGRHAGVPRRDVGHAQHGQRRHRRAEAKAHHHGRRQHVDGVRAVHGQHRQQDERHADQRQAGQQHRLSAEPRGEPPGQAE